MKFISYFYKNVTFNILFYSRVEKEKNLITANIFFRGTQDNSILLIINQINTSRYYSHL